MTITYSLSQPARVNITAGWANRQYSVATSVPQTPENQSFVWDGISSGGTILAPYADISCTIASYLPENHIITKGDTIVITGLQADPYAMHISYGQITRISYTLSRDAVVTVQLVPPSGSGITLLDNQHQDAGNQTLSDWTGLDTTDATGKRLLLYPISTDIYYMIKIQAINPQTGTTAIARGYVKIGI